MTSRDFCLVSLFLFSLQSWSQFYDAGLWSEISLQSKISQRTEIAVSPEVRMDENMTRVGRAFFDLGVQQKISSVMSLSCIYRSGVANDYELTEFRQRIQLGAAFKWKMKNWSLAYLPRWQVSVRGVGEYDADLSTVMRSRFQVKRDLPKKLEFSAYAEFFHSTGVYTFGDWQTWRANAVLSKNLKGPHSISLGYLIQHTLNSTIPKTDFVVLTSYRIDIDLKKKEKLPAEIP